MGEENMGSFTDHRDGKTYRTVQMPDSRIWMAENLDYDTQTTGSKCYKNNPANRQIYGMLYDWETAKNVAPPKGWHLPTQDEWEILLNAVGGFLIRGTYLKATNIWKPKYKGTDKFGFAALPGGLCNSAGKFSREGRSGYWWSADTNNINNNNAYFQYMNSTSNVYPNSSNKSRFYSVRCVQDLE